MDLHHSPGLRHRRHSRERVCFVDFDRHKVDSRDLHRERTYAAVMAA